MNRIVPLYAHSSKAAEQNWEPLYDHLSRVAALAARFASAWDGGRLAEAAGWLHDLGKARRSFQAYLKGGPGAEHAVVGAVEALARYPGLAGRLLAYVVAGHHGGLPNGGAAEDRDLDARLHRGRQINDMLPLPELPLPAVPEVNQHPAAFLTRMLYSALVDADFLATETFCTPQAAARRRAVAGISLAALEARLEAHLAGLRRDASAAVLACRDAVLRDCLVAAELPSGVFSLTAPTGAGKTLASLAFALRHARLRNKRRVVVAIPYTSIIDQTAQTFRTVFGADLAEAVLEHHSAVPPPDGEDPIGPERLRLAAENWDAPVIVTTTVQLFESLHAHRSSRCRKLHNLAGAVIILDEVQALPLPVLAPCLAALRCLAEEYGATVLLCSATLPNLRASPALAAGFGAVHEIVADVPRLFAALTRVRPEKAGALSNDALVERLAAEDRVLCIVDSRAQAAELCGRLGDALHLSAGMCPAHRRTVLDEVRRRLEDGVPCRLVSTQVIEAGVDVSFPVVYRSAAGIDSLAQAAGRCNRHGLLETGRFVVFDGEQASPIRELQRRRTLAEPIVAGHDDPLSLAAVAEYFGKLFAVSGTDGFGVIKAFGRSERHWPFRTIGETFRLIEADTVPVIVPWDEADALVEALMAAERGGYPVDIKVLRGLQQVSVSVYRGSFEALRAAGAVEMIGRFARLTAAGLYDHTLGLMQARERSPEENVI